MPRAAAARTALVSGRPLVVSGNAGKAMHRPMQQAAEKVLGCHFPAFSLSVIERIYH